MALAAMCRNNCESSHDRDVILEPLSVLKNVLPVQSAAPLLIPSDSTSSPLKSTRLGGHLISCFVVGGECRLCLPQILAMVLPNFTNAVVQELFSELQIHLSIATQEQLRSLKLTGLMPRDTSDCILIRKSDAERLVSRLLPQACVRLPNPEMRADGIPVYHDSFGGCTGLLIPSLITGEASTAIECSECKFLLTGENFASHTHSTNEVGRICHWGFDTANWKYYVNLAEELEDNIDAQQKLALFKEFEVQQKVSAFLSSQIRATKRPAEPKLEEIDVVNPKPSKSAKTMSETGDSADESSKKSLSVPTTNPLLAQFPPVSIPNLQLLLAYQNAAAQLPLLSFPQQLAKIASLSVPTPFVLPQNPPRFDAPKDVSVSTISATAMSEPSTSGMNLNNKILNGIPIGSSEPRRVEPSNNPAVPSLDKLLEENLSVNAYALARTLLAEERGFERQKRQQLEAQLEQLRVIVEQLRRDNTVYQAILSGTSVQDIRNLTTKTAIF